MTSGCLRQCSWAVRLVPGDWFEALSRFAGSFALILAAGPGVFEMILKIGAFEMILKIGAGF